MVTAVSTNSFAAAWRSAGFTVLVAFKFMAYYI